VGRYLSAYEGVTDRLFRNVRI